MGRLPTFRSVPVPAGDEVDVEGKRHFRSLVRDAKDPQRMVNYWRTTATELVALAPKAPFIGPKGAFVSDAVKWESANTTTHAYIEYDGPIPPQRQAFAGVPAGALQEAMNASDDIKAIIGMYGRRIGRAVKRSERLGDQRAQAGRRCLDLPLHRQPLPRDPPWRADPAGPDSQGLQHRATVIRVLQGRTATAQAAPLTDAGHAFRAWSRSLRPRRLGRYDLTVEAGPSFSTRREEAAEQMTELIRAYPAAAPVLGDLLAKNLDWPGAQEVSERLKALLPPQLQGRARRSAAATRRRRQAVQALQGQVAQLEPDSCRRSMADKALEARKLEIEAFKAETDRIALELSAAEADVGR